MVFQWLDESFMQDAGEIIGHKQATDLVLVSSRGSLLLLYYTEVKLKIICAYESNREELDRKCTFCLLVFCFVFYDFRLIQIIFKRYFCLYLYLLSLPHG